MAPTKQAKKKDEVTDIIANNKFITKQKRFSMVQKLKMTSKVEDGESMTPASSRKFLQSHLYDVQVPTVTFM